jgi:hypothetical protein
LTRIDWSIRWVLLALLCWPAGALAHAWGNTYSLPIPFEMYAYGAAVALIVSFVLVGFFAKADVVSSGDAPLSSEFSAAAVPTVSHRHWLALFRVVSVLGLALTIATGLFGNPSPYANFSMTFFWAVFVLGFTYLTALTCDLYTLINPWWVLCEWLERIWPGAFAARLSYPAWAGYWPALFLYGAFLWVELFGRSGPRLLAMALTIYIGITLLGAAIFGKPKWFQYGEFFGVFLRLISRVAPFERVTTQGRSRLRRRRPFEALTRAAADHPTLTLFILFMLSSTAFDGAHETLPWVNIFWRQIFPHLEPQITKLGLNPYDVAADLYYTWQRIMLVLAPFIYYGVYWLFIWMTKQLTRSSLSVGQLARHFALSLIPIALVYHVSHYFALLLVEGPSILALASDPFGFGWNLFGTATRDLSIVPAAGVVWHTQVWLILLGHIISVYASHVRALQVFPDRGQAVRSQIPILLLMVLLTSVGLWILSLPIAAGQVNSSVTPG